MPPLRHRKSYRQACTSHRFSIWHTHGSPPPRLAPKFLRPQRFGAEDFLLLNTIMALDEEAKNSPRHVRFLRRNRRLAIEYYGEEAVSELESENPQSIYRGRWRPSSEPASTSSIVRRRSNIW